MSGVRGESANVTPPDQARVLRPLCDRYVFPIAWGGGYWSFTDFPYSDNVPHPPDAALATRTIHAALEVGVTLIDTARAYTTADHPGFSEATIASALRNHPLGSEVMVATKGGTYRRGNDSVIDGSRDSIRRQCELSRDLLDIECIELYQLHVPDPSVPMSTAMATFAELRDDGVIRHIGVGNVSLDQLEEALSVVPIASVQNRFSPFDQQDRVIVDFCAERSIAFLAYSPLGGGRITGGRVSQLEDAFPSAAAVGRRKQMSIQRLTLAWLLTLSPTIIPISGATRPETIRDSALAAHVALTDSDLAALDFSG